MVRRPLSPEDLWAYRREASMLACGVRANRKWGGMSRTADRLRHVSAYSERSTATDRGWYQRTCGDLV
jgi:hypothetical protein